MQRNIAKKGVKVDERNRKRLQFLKLEWKKKSLNQVIAELLKESH